LELPSLRNSEQTIQVPVQFDGEMKAGKSLAHTYKQRDRRAKEQQEKREEERRQGQLSKRASKKEQQEKGGKAEQRVKLS
jgi:hypothetical protein